MLYRVIERYKKSDFLVSVTKLGSATTIAQLISIACAPVLYRIYDKADYGTLGLYMAITGVTGVFSTLQYLQTILLEKEDEDAINAMWLNRVINIGFSLLAFSVILILWRPITNFIENEALIKWLWLLPVSIFFSGQGEIFKVWANRKKEYTILTQNTMLSATAVPTISISLGLLFKSEMGLFIGLLSGQCLSAIFMVYRMRRNYDISYLRFNRDRIKALFYKHKVFPLFSLPSEFVNRFTNQLPVFMLNAYAGPSVVGVYNLATRMLGLPIQLVGGAISTVFQQKATHDYNSAGTCRPIFIKTFKSLSLIAIVPTLIIVFFGPDLFAMVFGEKWRESGEYARILMVMFSGRLIVSPLSYLFFIMNKQKEDFIWHIWMLFSNFLVFYFMLSYDFDLKCTLLVFSLNYSLIYLLYLKRAFKFSTNITHEIN